MMIVMKSFSMAFELAVKYTVVRLNRETCEERVSRIEAEDFRKIK